MPAGGQERYSRTDGVRSVSPPNFDRSAKRPPSQRRAPRATECIAASSVAMQNRRPREEKAPVALCRDVIGAKDFRDDTAHGSNAHPQLIRLGENWQ